MILGNTEIAYRGEDLISPYNPDQVQPSSYDCTLGEGFLTPATVGHPVELSDVPLYEPIQTHGCIVPAGGFVLGTTAETVKIPLDMVGQVEGVSSVGRLGLFIQNAGLIDPGFEGQITLEIFNASPNPITLRPGQRICQIIFSDVAGCSGGYSGKYQGQVGVVGSREFQDFGGVA